MGRSPVQSQDGYSKITSAACIVISRGQMANGGGDTARTEDCVAAAYFMEDGMVEAEAISMLASMNGNAAAEIGAGAARRSSYNAGILQWRTVNT